MPLIESNTGSPSSPARASRCGEERERLLQLGAREVRAQAVVDAGAERQRLRASRSAVMSKRSGSLETRRVAVAVERGDHHDRALGERHVAVLDLLERDPRGERRDRLVAQRLLDRARRRATGRARSSSHWSGCSASSRTAWASWLCVVSTPPIEHVQHQVHAARRRTAGRPRARRRSASRSGRRRGRARRRSSSAPHVRRRTRRTACSISSRSLGQVGASNWRWIQFDQSCSRGASSSGAPITVAIVSDGYGLRTSSTNSQRPPSATAPTSSSRKLAHRRPVALDRARGQRRVHEVAQAAVVVAVDVEDVAGDLLVQRPVGDAEDLGDLQPGERRRFSLRRKNSTASRSSTK